MRMQMTTFPSSKNYIDQEARLTLYYSFFHSYLNYGSILWSPSLSPGNLNKIRKKQNKAIRIIKNSRSKLNYDVIYSELKILPIEDHINFEMLKSLHKFVHKQLPDPLMRHFNFSSQHHTYPTRHSTDPRFPGRYCYNGLINSYICKGPTIWSKLPQEYKNICNPYTFSRQIKNKMIKKCLKL